MGPWNGGQEELVGGRFALRERAGAGGMGVVYRAIDTTTQRLVAVKLLHGHRGELADRFAREARLLAELVHPNIVGFVASGIAASGDPFLAMDWLDGETLSARLQRGTIPPDDAIRFVVRVAAAVEVAHARGVVHRDLKPANLFLVNGDLAQVKVLDFGIARVVAPGERVTTTGAMLGTPGYMPPEQARGEKDVDARCDVFAMGCLLFKTISGKTPWTGDPLAVMLKMLMEPAPKLGFVAMNVPEALEELVDRMLAKLPANRPRDAREVRVALEAILAGAPAPSGYVRSRPSRTQAPLLATRGCLLLARLPKSAGMTIAAAPLMSDEERFARVYAVAQSFGGGFSPLSEGAFVLQFSAGTGMNEIVAGAARCALALRPIVPDMQLALVAERPGSGTIVGTAIIDEGVMLLERAGGAMIAIDGVAARVLGDGFAMTAIDGGYQLVGDGALASTSWTGARSAATAAPPVRSASPDLPPRPRASLLPWIVAGIATALLVAGVVTVAVLFPRVLESSSHVAPASPAFTTPSTCPAGYRCSPVHFGDVHRVDPMKLVSIARGHALEMDRSAKLASLSATFSNPDGTMDLTAGDAAFYIFATMPGRYGIIDYVDSNGSRIVRATWMAVDDYAPAVVPEPCSYRSALGSLRALPKPARATASFNGDLWTLKSDALVGWSYSIDARTCRVKPP